MDFRRPLSVVTPTLDGDVLAVLAGAEEEYSGRQIHRVLGRGSEHGVRKAADRLVAQGIVLRRQAGRANLYRLNREHVAAPFVEGLGSLRAQLLARLRESIESWDIAAHSVLLFGSAARGEAGAGSDLDLLVVRPKDVAEDEPEWCRQLGELEREATAWSGNETRIVECGEPELSAPSFRALAEEVLRDGIELCGSRAALRRLLDEGSR